METLFLCSSFQTHCHSLISLLSNERHWRTFLQYLYHHTIINHNWDPTNCYWGYTNIYFFKSFVCLINGARILHDFHEIQKKKKKKKNKDQCLEKLSKNICCHHHKNKRFMNNKSKQSNFYHKLSSNLTLGNHPKFPQKWISKAISEHMKMDSGWCLRELNIL